MWATVDTLENRDLDRNVDLQFFDLAKDQITHELEIEPTTVSPIGMSNGASFAQLVAIARSEQISAVVAHSGTIPRWLHETHTSSEKSERIAAEPFSVLLIVGKQDLASEPMKANYEFYLEKGHATKWILDDGLGHEWARQYNQEMIEFLIE